MFLMIEARDYLFVSVVLEFVSIHERGKNGVMLK